MRSGDFTKLFLVIGAAGLMGLMVLRFKPYIADRFSVWRHVWEDPTDAGFQQVQTMTSIASGGIPGLGAGEGNLKDVAAASTDLVFGMLSEEWGLVIAVLAVLCIITLGVFAYRSIIAGRSTYYCIAACAATSMFMFQTILNVFGSVDLLPLTGVTFPFVSSGGTSMIVSWGMLAFLKAADTRQNASLAVRIHEKDPDKGLASVESVSAVDIYDPEDLYALLGEEYEKPPRKSRKEEKKEARRAEPEKIRAAEPAPEPQPVTKPAPKVEPKPAPKPQPEPERPAFQRPAATPGVRKEEPAHPKAVNYKEVSDDDFFGKFNPPSKPSKPKDEEDGPLTLDDIFGENGLFNDGKKGGKR